jgi:hypothetical protein
MDICLHVTNSIVIQVVVKVANVIPKLSRGVDEELSPKSYALILDQHTVFTGDFHVLVCNKRQLEVRSEAAFLARLVGPGEVREL